MASNKVSSNVNASMADVLDSEALDAEYNAIASRTWNDIDEMRASAIDNDALSLERIGSAEDVYELDLKVRIVEQFFSEWFSKFVCAFAVDGSHEYAWFVRDYLKSSEQTKSDMVKMAIIRYIESKSHIEYTGEIPASKQGSVTGYNAEYQRIIQAAGWKAFKAGNAELANLYAKFNREVCDALIVSYEKIKANKAARKNGKVTTKAK